MRLARGVSVGPGAVLRGPLRVGPGTAIDALAVVAGPAVLGKGNRIFPGAVLGGPPQHREHLGEPTRLVVGDGNVFREHVTVHRGTCKGGGVTRIGDGNMLMTGVHVAHDCGVGRGVELANGVTLGGHAIVGDGAVFGGLAAVAPFVRIGERAMVAGGAMVDRDVPPFCVVRGDRARVAALNLVGLRRAGVPAAAIGALREAFRILFVDRLPWAEALAACRRLRGRDPRVAILLRFLRASKLGVRR